MIIRDNTRKEVMFICDHPLLNEEKRGIPYSEASSTTLKDALGNASHIECKNQVTKHLLNSSTICYTYLSITRYADHDFDWAKSVVNKKNIPEGEEYFQIPYLKDVWVSGKVQISINSLIKQIKEVQPKLIIIGGKWAFLFLATLYTEQNKQLATVATTKSTVKDKKMFGGLNKFRSSILTLHDYYEVQPTVVIPVLTPSFLFLVKDKDFAVKRDYAKIAYLHRRIQNGLPVSELLCSDRIANIGYTKEQCLTYFNALLAKIEVAPVKVSIDIETRQGAIDCIGFAYEDYSSFTVPFSYMVEEANIDPYLQAWCKKSGKDVLLNAPIGAILNKYKNFWPIEDEVEICTLMWKIMLHKNCLHVGQNYNYDCQWFWRDWKMKINSNVDTMICHHVLHNTLSKDLATLASIYCMDFVMWKDEIWAD